VRVAPTHSTDHPIRSSILSSAYAQAARAAVLEFFSADASEYDVIFTANCTAALRLVGESYPFTSNASRLILPVDAHNSVNGLREFATSAGIPVQYLPMERCGDQFSALDNDGGLFVMTGQSNLSGLKSDLNLMAEAKQKGYDTLLDAAALASTTPLSLRALGNSVDAMAISLYKIIGYPTGVGCLVARKAFLAKLNKQWFSGGTVVIVQVMLVHEPGLAHRSHDSVRLQAMVDCFWMVTSVGRMGLLIFCRQCRQNVSNSR